MADGSKVNHYLRRLESLETERKRDWESHWRELAYHFLPRRGRFLDAGEETNRGDRRNKLWDSTGILARRTLSAGMHSSLTSPARPWFSLTMQDKDLAAMDEVKRWLEFVYEQLTDVLSQSNFYDEVHLLYDEITTFGTGVMLVEEDRDSVIRCRTLTVGEYCIDSNAGGRIDTIYRRVRFTPRQIAQKFPRTCPDSVRCMAESDSIEWLTVLHVVEPRKPDEIVDTENASPTQRPYRSVYIFLEGGGGNKGSILDESGFFEFPAMVSRWNVTASDVYGSSPAMDALPDTLALQAMAKDGLLALELEVKPPLAISHDVGLTKINLSPGGKTYVPSLGGNLPSVTPLYNVRANLAALESYKAHTEQKIQKLLYNDLFLMLAQTDKVMTAREVIARNAEKMLIIGPVTNRLMGDQRMFIMRVFNIMYREGLIPEPPDVIMQSGAGVSIEFVSILAQAQKQAGLEAVANTIEFVRGIAQMSPEVFDKLDFDEAVDRVSEMNGLPPSIIRADELVGALREQRAQQIAQQQQAAQMAQMLAMAKEGAGAAKDAGLTADNMALAMQGGT